MNNSNPISNLLGAPLSPDWTVEELAEQVLGAMAGARLEEGEEFVLAADASTDRQVHRLLRPVLACLATKWAAEAGTSANLYGGHFTFQRPGPNGPVWISGQFENRPGSVRVTFRRSCSPLGGERYGTVPHKPPVEVPETVPNEEGSKAGKRVKLKDPQLEPKGLPRRTRRSS